MSDSLETSNFSLSFYLGVQLCHWAVICLNFSFVIVCTFCSGPFLTQHNVLSSLTETKFECPYSFNRGPIHNREFGNGDSTVKTHQVFSVHTTPEEFKNAPITGHFAWICVSRRLGQGNHMIIVTSLFSERSVFKMFSAQAEMINRRFSNSSSLKSVFENLRCRDGLV